MAGAAPVSRPYKKWEVCRAARGGSKYVICNADEGDPGAFMNRALIESDPHAVLEGMLIGGYAIGARQGIVYVRAEYPLAVVRLKKAVEQLRAYGLLGENIQGSGFNFDITIREGAGAFVCGEETALIASLEGQRGMPRPRPPYPAEKGLNGLPNLDQQHRDLRHRLRTSCATAGSGSSSLAPRAIPAPKPFRWSAKCAHRLDRGAPGDDPAPDRL